MKLIKNIGLGIFCGSLLLFVSTLFLNDYKIDIENLNKLKLTDIQKSTLEKHAQEFDQEVVPTKADFVRLCNAIIVKSNNDIIDRYSIKEEELTKIISIALSFDVFKPAVFDSVYTASNDVGIFKSNILKSYTSWMNGKRYGSENELKGHLESTIININENIAANKGFDKNKIKSIELELVKESSFGFVNEKRGLLLILIFVIGIVGALLHILPKAREGFPGIKNNNIYFNSLNNRGLIGIILGGFLILFYILLYWFPLYITEWIILVDPLSLFLNGKPANNWFLYGFLYTLAILVMGVRFFIKYRHSKYHKIRTISVMFFQLAFAFILANVLGLLNLPEVDLKNIWPLDYSFFYEWRLREYMAAGTIGYFMLAWGIILFALLVPILTYFYGKRWYCSWVCGCGGLAETAGDPFRQLSDKSLRAWKTERYLIHGVLVFAVVMTVWVLFTFFTERSQLLGIDSYKMRSAYGFLISSIFAGVVGTGFYPLMGNRVWCRFGCPLAAYIGIVQRFKSRFRITTNGSQCISCGNCSVYCEMGIDVRWYAQRGQNIVRSSCVGCGICSAVCPRGVLRLENGPEKNRIKEDPVF